MDACPICGGQFKRHYRRRGLRQTFCSKRCSYEATKQERVCKTCGKRYVVRLPSRRKEYCSLECIQRNACEACGKIITGRNKTNGRLRRFCSHTCSALINRTIKAKNQYITFGFASCIRRHGKLHCEHCGDERVGVLVVHHKDRNKANNVEANLLTLCANCHALEHDRDKSINRAAAIRKAEWLAVRLGAL